MPIDPLAIIFDQVSLMTRGLINDMTTLVLGVLACTFIVIGLDVLLTILGNPIVNFQRGKSAVEGAINSYRMAHLPSAPTRSLDRHDVEVSPLLQRDLDYAGSLEAPDRTYINNHWENDGVELSEDRYAALESAMDEAEYISRRKARLSDDEADDLVNSHAKLLRD